MRVRGVFGNYLYEEALFMLSVLLRICVVSSALFAILTSLDFVWLCNNNEEFKYPGSWISEATSALICWGAAALF